MYVSSMLLSFVVFTWYILCNYIHTYILHVHLFNIWKSCWCSKCLAPARKKEKVVFVLISSNTILQHLNVVQTILVILSSRKEFTERENASEFWPDFMKNAMNVWCATKECVLTCSMCTCLDIHINETPGFILFFSPTRWWTWRWTRRCKYCRCLRILRSCLRH